MITNRRTDTAESAPGPDGAGEARPDRPDADSPSTTRLSVRRKIEKAAPRIEQAERPASSKYDDVLNTVLRIAEGDGKFEHKLRRTQGIVASHHAASRAAHRNAPNVNDMVEADRQGLLAHLRQACDGGTLNPGQLELLEAVLAP